MGSNGCWSNASAPKAIGAMRPRSIWSAMRMTVRQAMSVRDEGRPLGAGLRRQAPNHRERLGSRALVVSVPAKRHGGTVSGTNRKGDRKGTTDDVSKA